MSKITKGPWEITGFGLVHGPEGWREQGVADCGFALTADETEANTRSIAAVPDMIEALQAYKLAFTSGNHDLIEHVRLTNHANELMVKALRKAGVS
jgi:hypothetical protein